MRSKTYILLGASGSTKSIIDILSTQNDTITGILDDDSSLHGNMFYGHKVLGSIDKIFEIDNKFCFDEAVVCIGSRKDTTNRRLLFERLKAHTIVVGQAISPSAYLSPTAVLGEGCIIMPNVIINSGAILSDNVFVHSGATIEHDCRISSHTFLSPGVVLSGYVQIGEGTFIGAGAVVNTDIGIGKNVTVGSGSVVIRNVPDNVVIYGSPAHKSL